MSSPVRPQSYRLHVTEADLAQFAIQHGQPNNTRSRGQNREWALYSARGYPTKTIRVAYDHWQDIVRLVERQSYRLPSDNIGLAGENVRLFAAALQRGVEEEKLDAPLHDAAVRLLEFVRGPARDGFRMQSEWKA